MQRLPSLVVASKNGSRRMLQILINRRTLRAVLTAFAIAGPARCVVAAELLAPPPAIDEDRDIVTFAAGAIELALPPDWVATEVHVGREVRLYLTPRPLAERARSKQSEVWITYHVRTADMRPGELEAFAAQRLRRTAPDDATHGAGSRVDFAGHRAVRRDFHIVRGDIAGEHFVVPVEWGIVEIQSLLPAKSTADRETVRDMLAGLVLRRPTIRREPSRSETRDATAVVGTWKAERSRMTLTAAGYISLEYHAHGRRQIDLATARVMSPPRRLEGRYEARGDLLLVAWGDGSRMNMRWQTADGDLLLTDHNGRISQLKRLLE